MAKGKGGGRGMPAPRNAARPANSQNMLQSLQQKMLEAQEALANDTIDVSVGGGAVTVVMSGKQELRELKISPEAMSAGDVDMLQDLIIAAVNEALGKSQELAARRISTVTGGLNLPGPT
ncbi:MAG: YbaB/EbfC family nucleoid-associated protein [Chloroflexi bacterium]|nr:YbaB/EbfC family nucleoid-associated protein [Chloroflexota bacterium]